MRRATFARIILLSALIGVVTIGLQVWLGGTLYSPENAPRRAALHEYILHNRLPLDVQWDDLGASNGLNIRIGVVLLAEELRRALNAAVIRAYFLIDTPRVGREPPASICLSPAVVWSCLLSDWTHLLSSVLP